MLDQLSQSLGVVPVIGMFKPLPPYSYPSQILPNQGLGDRATRRLVCAGRI